MICFYFSTGDDDRQDMDIILLLSQRAVFVAWYDDDEEQITQYQRIFLEDIEKVEIGIMFCSSLSYLLLIKSKLHIMSSQQC